MDGVTTVTDRGVPPDDDSHPWMSLLHELDSCEPLYNATGPAQGGKAFSGWEVPDWLMKRVHDALRAGRCPDCALLADGAPGEIEAGARASQPLTLDVERLAKAMRWAGIRCEPDFATIEEAARQLASDYASTLLDPE